MIDLTRKSLPNTIAVGGRNFLINTDFRIWIRFSIEYKQWIKNGMEDGFDISFLFKEDIPEFCCSEDYNSIFEFAYPSEVVPHSDDSSLNEVLFYEYDGDYIYSAFMQAYGIDLLEVTMHWRKFHALLNGLPESTRLSSIMGYRAYTGKTNDDVDKQYERLKESWLPKKEDTVENIQSREAFNDFFG